MPPRMGPAAWPFLRTARERRGLSVKRLAMHTALSVPFLYNLEAGHRSASDEVLDKLAKVLDVTYEQLYTTRPTPPSRARATKGVA